MSFVERILNKFGYVKAGKDTWEYKDPTAFRTAVEPSDFPSSMPSSPNEEDFNRQDIGNNKNELVDNPGPIGRPENLQNSKPPTVTLNHSVSIPEDKQMASPDNSMAMPESTNTGAPSSQPQNSITETHIKPEQGMGIEEINSLNPAIALKMQKVGILTLDRDIFMNWYTELLRQAALARKPFSEYVDETLK